MEEEPLLKNTPERGGLKAVLFILATDAVDKMASQGIIANMILYLTQQYHMETATAANILNFSSSANSFMPIIGAFLADSYLGRFHTIAFASVIYVLGLLILWSTTIIPQARPPPCYPSNGICESPTSFQFMYLCASLALVSVGAGGIRSSSVAFGADQLERGFRRSPGLRQRYFGWYYASSTVSVILAQTVIVYIQDRMGWAIGFAVPPLLMLIGAISFYSASPFYVKMKSDKNLISGLLQVAVASFRNRHLRLSEDGATVYHWKGGSAHVSPSKKLRFVNKACVIIDPERDISPDGTAKDPWSLCTVDQVEDLKAVIKVIPIWSTGMIFSINLSQNSFAVLQTSSMDRRIFGGFTIPAASFGTVTIISIILWVILYDRVFLPLASRVMRRPVHLSSKTRMGIGILLSFLASMAAAVVINIRQGLALAGVAMSAMWLVPYSCLSGFSDAANMIGQIEFYFSEFPRNMSSIASSVSGIGMSFGSLLASLIVDIVDRVSKAGGHESWISDDINKGHYDYYYLVLAGLSLANFVYFLVCSKAHGPLKEEEERKPEEEDVQL